MSLKFLPMLVGGVLAVLSIAAPASAQTVDVVWLPSTLTSATDNTQTATISGSFSLAFGTFSVNDVNIVIGNGISTISDNTFTAGIFGGSSLIFAPDTATLNSSLLPFDYVAFIETSGDTNYAIGEVGIYDCAGGSTACNLGTDTLLASGTAELTLALNVPEPASMAIFGAGLAGLAALRRRSQNGPIGSRGI